MVIDDPARLQMRINGNGTHVFHASLFQITAHLIRQPVPCRYLASLMSIIEVGFSLCEAPDVFAERSEFPPYLLKTAGIMYHSLYLPSGTDHPVRVQDIAAAKAARADFFIRTLPKGYDTVLGGDADNISAGQRQLLTIARVMLCDPAVLILDEATSSVDTRTEMEIGKAMSELMKNRTSFVIAHRLSTIVDADLILVMQNGDIIEKGNHRELLRAKGAYAELYNSQFA